MRNCTHQLATIAELSQQAVATTNLLELMDKTVELIAKTLEVEYVSILELLPDSRAWLLRAGVGWQSDLVGHLSVNEDSQSSYTLITNERVIVEDLRTESRLTSLQFLHDYGVVSSISIPIKNQDRSFGVLGVHATTRRTFTEDNVYFLQAIANLLAASIERQRAEKLLLEQLSLTANENTERQRVEEALQRSEAQNQALLNAIPDLMIRMSRDGTYLDFRRTKYFKTLMPEQNLVGKSDYEVVPEKIARERMSYVEQALRTGQPQIYEYQIAIDGNITYEEARIVVSGEDEVLAIIRDVTERKQIETALQQAKEKYLSIFENAIEGIFQVTLDGYYISANPALAHIYGYESSEEFLTHVTDNEQRLYVHPDRGVEFIHLMQQNQTIKKFESQVYRKDGSIIWTSKNARPIVDTNNVALYYEGFVEDITERKHSEEALLRISKAVENTGDAISIADVTDTQIYQNQSFQKLFGYNTDELNAAGGISLIYRHQAIAHEVFSNIKHGQSWSGDVEMKSLTGCRMQIALRADAIKDQNGQIVGFVRIYTDITERKQAEVALRRGEQRLRAIFENTAIGIGLADTEGRHIETNPAWQKMLGYSNVELCNMSFMDITHPDDVATDVELYKQLVAGRINHYQMEKRYIRKNGELTWGRLTISLVRGNKSEPHFSIAMIENITERKQAEEKLLHHATHDVLTNLPNRALFLNHLDSAIKHAQSFESYLFAVLFLDLDRFKNINDSLGHLVGDQMLMAIAKKLVANLRTGDLVARLGGDEFAILLKDIESVSDATCIAERIQKELSLPLNLDGYEMFTTVSIGITLSTYGYSNSKDILRDADTAMYRAKGLGKARYEIFNKAMHENALTVLQLENDLRRAIERQEFLLHYQPIIALETNRVAGFEVLVRWQHPLRGLIAPAEFIPVAEETGLILPIGNWVLYEACRQMREWQLQSHWLMPLTISVNISSKQFLQPALVEQISQILQETNLEAHSLKLELTESVLMDNTESAVAMLHKLKAMNIQLYMDDFGTGYSSLSYLHRFPVDALKIDRSFVSRMGVKSENAKIVQTIVTLANNLRMDVVAEGVETVEQVMQLRALGCKYGQGYFFSRPLDRHAIGALIATNSVESRDQIKSQVAHCSHDSPSWA